MKIVHSFFELRICFFSFKLHYVVGFFCFFLFLFFVFDKIKVTY